MSTRDDPKITVHVNKRTFIASFQKGVVVRIREVLVRIPVGKQDAFYTKPWWHKKHHRPDVEKPGTIKAQVIEKAEWHYRHNLANGFKKVAEAAEGPGNPFKEALSQGESILKRIKS